MIGAADASGRESMAVSHYQTQKLMRAYGWLHAKPDKTPEELAALSSSHKFLAATVVLVLIVMTVGVLMLKEPMDDAYSPKTYGYVDGDLVSAALLKETGGIVMGDYPLSDFGIDPASVSDGEKIIFCYDKNDRFLYAEPDAIHHARSQREMLMLVAVVCVLTFVPIFVIRKTIAKPFLAWYKEFYNG